MMEDNPFSAFDRMLKTTNAFKQQFSALDLANSFSNQFKLNKDFNLSTQFESIFKIYNQHKQDFPIMDNYLKGIEQNHLSLFSKWEKLGQITSTVVPYPQILNMQAVLSSVGSQAAAFAVKNERWNLLEDFDEITNEVVEINDRITDQQTITRADLNEIKDLIQRIEIKIDEKDKDFFSLVLKWLTIIGFILAVIGEARFLTTSPNTVDKQDYEEFKKNISKTIDEKLTDRTEINVINRNCNVRLKPNKRTLIVGTLDKGEEVIILQTNGKWAYVKVKNNLTLNGWVYKKYIDR